ncbi:hypothetical protein FVE85_1619 [Porphyridium purpureum]|uniref:Uncharacterized protein n=1 Tax=Porphyridium purpureum TaxID=35688 RepID=A0A5J4YXQ9_PORPP|nr:hypothetical protein FVE85_1619 [Porphyridium purpureum]|eukprot:POR3969..scf209_3
MAPRNGASCFVSAVRPGAPRFCPASRAAQFTEVSRHRQTVGVVVAPAPRFAATRRSRDVRVESAGDQYGTQTSLHAGFPTGREWDELVQEFETRAEQAGNGGVQPLDLRDELAVVNGQFGQRNPQVYASMPVIETAFMAALMVVLWFLGRYLKLDAFLVLTYPLPIFLLALRWGLRYAAVGFLMACLMISLQMGLLFGISYLCNQGVMSIMFAIGMLLPIHWCFVLVLGSLGKMTGILMSIQISGFVFREDIWDLVRKQAVAVCETVMKVIAASKAKGGAVPEAVKIGAPTSAAINRAMLGLLVFSSVYSAFFTYLISSFVLENYSYMLRKRVTLIPVVEYLRKRRQRRLEKQIKREQDRKYVERG